MLEAVLASAGVVVAVILVGRDCWREIVEEGGGSCRVVRCLLEGSPRGLEVWLDGLIWLSVVKGC